MKSSPIGLRWRCTRLWRGGNGFGVLSTPVIIRFPLPPGIPGGGKPCSFSIINRSVWHFISPWIFTFALPGIEKHEPDKTVQLAPKVWRLVSCWADNLLVIKTNNWNTAAPAIAKKDAIKSIILMTFMMSNLNKKLNPWDNNPLKKSAKQVF